ncbi:MEMO1 family [Lipomyces japonicus]|uniref:MEMO1 family n=1 Tax=Lipomyces japonicus TaxID=56871 RepID=UPI0034CF914E
MSNTNHFVRRATHAGSWYLGDGQALDHQLTEFLDGIPSTSYEHGPLPVPDARIIIAPHAGYSYSGPTGAWAYKFWDVSKIERVFLLGPSHHVYLSTCAVSQAQEYETPLGNLPIDTETIEKLRSTESFQTMSRTVDEEEHSLEMHLPFIYKILSSSPGGIRPLVPIMIGALSAQSEREFGKILSPYLNDSRNGFVISSDFCHWGTRFGYTNYLQDSTNNVIKPLRSASDLHTIVKPDFPIYKSIEIIDYLGMDVSSAGSHAEWTKYLSHTKNTICGRHPISVLIAGIEFLRDQGVELALEQRKPASGTGPAEIVEEENLQNDEALKYQFGKLYWVQYKQSSHCHNLRDSSVSYASGFAKA